MGAACSASRIATAMALLRAIAVLLLLGCLTSAQQTPDTFVDDVDAGRFVDDVVPEEEPVKPLTEFKYSKLEGGQDDPEDEPPYLTSKNSEGDNRIAGDGRSTKKLEDGSITSKATEGAYTSEDAYTGTIGHYYLGASRRRIGAGFARRRRGDIPNYSDDEDEEEDDEEGPDVKAAPDKEAQKECIKKAGGIDFKTQVHGQVKNVRDQHLEAEVTVTYINYITEEKHVAYSDANGAYSLELPRCQFFLVRFAKPGLANDDGPGGCMDPFLVSEPEVNWIHGVSPVMKDDEIRAMLSWQPQDGGHTHDVDLHMLIPGLFDVTLPQYAHLDPTVQMTDKMFTKFNGTDVSDHHEGFKMSKWKKTQQFNGKYHTYWLHRGSPEEYPYAWYEMDIGDGDSEYNGNMLSYGYNTGAEEERGPEGIKLFQLLPKQYLIFVNCWSCGGNVGNGDQAKMESDVTPAVLTEFYQTMATVAVVQGDRQTYCKAIQSAPKMKTTTRWDVAVVRCNENSGKDGNACAVHDVNTFIKEGNNKDLQGLMEQSDDAEDAESKVEAIENNDAVQQMEDAHNNPPQGTDTSAPGTAPPLACPEGTDQVGAINADIGGCGLHSCSERYTINTIEACKSACEVNSKCNAFTWAPIGGDKNHMDQSACTQYTQTEPTSTWGPNQIFCKITHPELMQRT